MRASRRAWREIPEIKICEQTLEDGIAVGADIGIVE
jgi:hypothetical protein